MEDRSGGPQHRPSNQEFGFVASGLLSSSTPAMAQQHTSSSGMAPMSEYYTRLQKETSVAQMLAARSADGLIVATPLQGSHNHPRPSQRLYGSGSQGYMVPPVYAAGTSMPMTGERGDQLSRSSDTEEQDDGEETPDGDFAGATAMERHVDVIAPADIITVQTMRGASHRNEKRRSKSKVWEDFTPVFSDGKIQGAVCKHCEKSLSGKTTGRTSHLRRHLKTCPAQPATGRLQQQQSSSNPDSSSVEKNWNFGHQEKYLELAASKAWVSNLCYFSLTGNPNFRQFFSSICPYDLASQSAIREKLLDTFENEKLKLKEKIALAPGGVFLAVTKWRLECKVFTCVTVHFTDKEWKMNRKIIRCGYLGDEADDTTYDLCMFHDWESYCQWRREGFIGIIKEVVQGWSLGQKLLGIALPESEDDLCKLDLPENQNYLLAKDKLLALPCIVHALHTLFSYDCPNTFIVEISKDWFKYMTCSPLRRGKYEAVRSQLLLDRPCFFSKWWYGTYYLLEVALQFDKALPNLEKMDPGHFYSSKPSCEKLQATENFCSLVRQIYDAIKVISSPCNVTLDTHFHMIWNLKIALMGLSRKENIDKVFDVEEMHNRFHKFWRKWYLWLSLAVVLHPSYKFRFLDISFKQAFGSGAKRYTLEVRGKMYQLFLLYSCHVDQQSGEHLNQRNNDLQVDAHGNIPVRGTCPNYNEQSANDELGELMRYLEGDLIPQSDDFDILKWWKENASMYPTLARLARDILVIPGSAASAESVFDETDERVSLFSRKMSTEVIEALICTQDWIKSSEINDEVNGNINMPA